MTTPIIIETVVKAPLEKVWHYWNEPEHIINWCFASDDWCVPNAVNTVAVGEKFNTRMEAKDGSAGFDFGGVYTEVEENRILAYVMDDGRKVRISFEEGEEGIKITETFDPESENSLELQQQGWQAILDNFKKYAESK